MLPLILQESPANAGMKRALLNKTWMGTRPSSGPWEIQSQRIAKGPPSMQSNSVQRARHAAKEIRTEAEAEVALTRAERLSGCLEGSAEEVELISLLLAL